jgi:hypothetical protein
MLPDIKERNMRDHTVGSPDDDEKRAIAEAMAKMDEAAKPVYAPGGLSLASGAEAGQAGPKDQEVGTTYPLQRCDYPVEQGQAEE